MKQIAVVGASGVLGQELIRQLSSQSYEVRSIIRDVNKLSAVAPYSKNIWMGDARYPEELAGCFRGIDTVITTLGKSISIFTHEPDGFYEIDYRANINLLCEAQRAGVHQFVYVSIFGSESSSRLRQGWMQEQFSQELMKSGLSYTIVKPVGLFSGLHDLVIMGRWGAIPTPGSGLPKTNPIHQKDLARFCVAHLHEHNAVLEVGGPEIHSRNEVAKLVCRKTKCRTTVNIPTWIVKLGLGFIRLLISQNLYDKLAFFTFITTHEMVAPKYGQQTFEDYLARELDEEG